MQTQDSAKTFDFDSIRLKLASPKVIHGWSHGEVLKPETINYRTQKPEKDGLFCERIFGPSKDWECYCSKYKKIRYKGIVCDKCGVEVTRSIVRRERMGHIDLATPVAHIWFLRSVPSKVGMILDLSPQALEKVIYFANFIVTKVEEPLKNEVWEQAKNEYKTKKKNIEKECQRRSNEIKNGKFSDEEKEKSLAGLTLHKEKEIKELEDLLETAEKEIKELKVKKIIPENVYQDLSLKYGHIFEASIGAEAVRFLLEQIDLDKLIKELEKETEGSRGGKKEKNIRRLKLLKSLKNNQLRPEWMILTTVPVIPPDLRPMVALDGGRFATSDLNDLYRRVINRNNRLKQLLNLNAPEVIIRNEKRMLQEAVDALIDNSARHGKTVIASTGQRRMLKSLADILKGKQGRFRQNLLGKRVDYSGRSVIVVGPFLKLNECGLPKQMALELFKPFVISKLIKYGYIHNVRSGARFIESGRPEVWDILEEVIKDAFVLLNRAPTLHRLGIQAFRPILIEGKAIQIHPLVCPAFNADFDGDQMAVHVPLTEEAQTEAREIMQSSKNLLKPATGDPVVTPNQDIVWGCYYLTSLEEKEKRLKPKIFSSKQEAVLVYDLGQIYLREPIKVRFEKGEIVDTSVGRIIFNKIVPKGLGYVNEAMVSKSLKALVKKCLDNYGREKTVEFLDQLKALGFSYLTKSGFSWGMGDLPNLPEKQKILREAEKYLEEIQNQYEMGLLTNTERHSKVIETWADVKNKIVKIGKDLLDPKGALYSIIESGARGSWSQLTQVIGMKGLVSNPAGEIIELPIKNSFKEGFDVLEYFISTHGSRKGLSDTALRTSNAGYLTRRLVDVAQDVFIINEDCHDKEGVLITKEESEEIGEGLINRIIGHFVLEDIIDPKTKKIIAKKGELVTEDKRGSLETIDPKKVKIRSVLSCKNTRGLCRKCYGNDLGYNRLVDFGVATGIIAAQSIGEPGTQLTMRTFHTGGVAEKDITQGLPRVEELFEARSPKRKAILADVSGPAFIEQHQRSIKDSKGRIIIENVPGQRVIKIEFQDVEEDKYDLIIPIKSAEGQPKTVEPKIKVKDGHRVDKGAELGASNLGVKIKAKRAGVVKINNEKKQIKVLVEATKVREYIVPQGINILIKSGQMVEKGAQLTDGSLDLQQLYALRGKTETQKYIIKEIQYIYSSQGQKLNDKHIEIIARQMFSKVYVKDAGDTDLLPGKIIDISELEEANQKIDPKEGKPAKVEELLLGITKVSLSTPSFLAAASFQETSRILIDAAISGKIDRLEGLKENVIIGRLIPVGTGFRKKKG
ncbi:MAG: DNA-directed RNA polymerase subunit beta' [bacterium]